MNGLAESNDVFSQAYSEGFPKTVKFLKLRGATPELAEEVAQGAWTRGWEARHQLKEAISIIPWVNSIAYHRFCTLQRRHGRSVDLTELRDDRVREPTARLDAELLLRRCSPLERILLQLRYVEGLGLKEIGATHGLTEMSVRMRIHRCQHALRSIATDGVRSGAISSLASVPF